MEKQFCRVRSAKDVAISVTLLVAGMALMLLPYGGVGVTIGGFFLFLLGGLFLSQFKSVYKDKDGDNNVYLKKELFFRRELLQDILDAVESHPQTIDMKKEGLGWTIKLNLYYCIKADKAYLQLFEYVPYNYEPCSQMLEYKVNQIANLLKAK